MCLAGCLAVSPVCAHQVPVVPSGCENQDVSRHRQMSPGGGGGRRTTSCLIAAVCGCVASVLRRRSIIGWWEQECPAHSHCAVPSSSTAPDFYMLDTYLLGMKSSTFKYKKISGNVWFSIKLILKNNPKKKSWEEIPGVVTGIIFWIMRLGMISYFHFPFFAFFWRTAVPSFWPQQSVSCAPPTRLPPPHPTVTLAYSARRFQGVHVIRPWGDSWVVYRWFLSWKC